MKIKSIEINKDCAVLALKNKKLIGVILNVVGFFGIKKQIKAFPNNYGVTGAGGGILYYIFSDELGKEFDDGISKQINNYLLSQELLSKF